MFPYRMLLLCLCCILPVAQAQNIQSLPGASVGSPQLPHPSVSPLSDPLPDFSKPKQPDINYEQPKQEQQKQSSSATQSILIRKIQVQGAERLEMSDINKLVLPFEGRSSTLDELQSGVVNELSKLYEKKGYISAVVFIPPQKIENGILTVQVEEGIVSEIEFEEGRYFKDWAVEPRLHASTGKILNIRSLQASIRRINENPDLRVQAVMKAGNEPGTMRVTVRPAEEHAFLHVAPFMDNMGRYTIGNNRLGFTVHDNNTLGLGDISSGTFAWNRHSWSNASSYEIPLGKYGTKAGFSYAYNHFDFSRANLSFNGSATLATPYISQELRRTENSSLTAELGLGIKSAGLNVEDLELNQDRIRTLTPALNYTESDRWGRTMVRHELGIGLNIWDATLGNSPTTSRPGAGSKFFRYTSYAVRAQRLPFRTYGVLKLMGQMTPSQLVSLEQFQIGGASTIRGYQQGLLIGDSGFVSSFEWHVPLNFLPLPEQISLFRRRYNPRNSIELVAFADNGGVFGTGRMANVNHQSNHIVNRAFLGSVGAGLRVNLTRFIAARLDLGIPYVRIRGDKTAAWLHFGFESRIF